MFCEKCGEELGEGAQFCSSCGTTVQTAKQTIPTQLKSNTQSVQAAPKVGIIDTILDAGVKKISGRENIRITPEQLAQIVYEKFIQGADSLFLTKITKIMNSKFCGGKIVSKDERYRLELGPVQAGIIFGVRRTVWIHDINTKSLYIIKDKEHKKFRRLVLGYINQLKLP